MFFWGIVGYRLLEIKEYEMPALPFLQAQARQTKVQSFSESTLGRKWDDLNARVNNQEIKCSGPADIACGNDLEMMQDAARLGL